MLKKSILIFASFVTYSQTASALVACGPSSCYAACDSSCTYYTCSYSKTHTITVNSLPVSTDTEPSDACAHSAITANSAPFNAPGSGEQKSVPATFAHSYIACQAQTNYGPACPPPPPPPPPPPGPPTPPPPPPGPVP